MREGIGLYKAKRIDKREWIEGYFFAKPILEKYFIIEGENQWMVDPETVGQWTGLADKNGAKVFEGDIVRITDDEGNTDFSDGGKGAVEFLEGMWYVGGQVNNGLYDLHKCYLLEKIGNIHDKAVEE